MMPSRFTTVARWLGARLIAISIGFWLGGVSFPNGQQAARPLSEKPPAGGKSKSSPSTAAPSITRAEPVFTATSPGLEALRIALRPVASFSSIARGEGYGALPGLSAADMPAALRMILAQPSILARRALVRNLFECWAKLGLPSALRAFATIESPQMQQQALQPLLAEWGKTDETAAWQWASNQPDPVLQATSVRILLETLAVNRDPTPYLAWTEKLTDSSLRNSLLTALSGNWAARDPQASLAWAQALESDTLRLSMLSNVLQRWQDKGAALVSALSRPDLKECPPLLANLMRRYAESDPKGAADWISRTPPAPWMQLALHEAAPYFAGHIALTQALAIADGFAADPLRDAFAAPLAACLAEKNQFTEALALLAKAGPSMERDSALMYIGQAYAKFRPAQAQAWLKSLTDERDRSNATGGFELVAERSKP